MNPRNGLPGSIKRDVNDNTFPLLRGGNVVLRSSSSFAVDESRSGRHAPEHGHSQRLAEEMAVMHELPERRTEPAKRERVRVDSGSLIYVDRNTYSVPRGAVRLACPQGISAHP